MVLKEAGVDVMNSRTSSRSQKHTLHMKMKVGKIGKAMACTPGTQE